MLGLPSLPASIQPIAHVTRSIGDRAWPNFYVRWSLSTPSPTGQRVVRDRQYVGELTPRHKRLGISGKRGVNRHSSSNKKRRHLGTSPSVLRGTWFLFLAPSHPNLLNDVPPDLFFQDEACLILVAVGRVRQGYNMLLCATGPRVSCANGPWQLLWQSVSAAWPRVS